METQGTLDAFCPDHVSSDAAAVTGRIDRIIWSSGSNPPRLTFVQPDLPRENQTGLPLTAILGEQVRVQLQSEQYCTKCGAEAEQSICRDCAGEPPFTTCVKQPAKRCSYADCPYPDYKERSCSHEFVVYLVTAGGVKVGITKRTRTLSRWQEQGADYALPIATAPNRRAAGIIERAVSQIEYIGQRLTHEWYVPMENPVSALVDAALDALERIPSRLEECRRWAPSVSNEEVRNDVVSVPFLQTSELNHRLASRHGRLQPGNAREGRVIGVRGSLIATDEFVVNISRHSGHGITIESEAPFVKSFDADAIADESRPRAGKPPAGLDGTAEQDSDGQSEPTDKHPIENFF